MRNSTEVFDLITKLSSEAEWSTNELREAIREEGFDPDELMQSVLGGLKEIQIPAVCNNGKDYHRLLKAGRVLTSSNGLPMSKFVGRRIKLSRDQGNIAPTKRPAPLKNSPENRLPGGTRKS